MQEITPKHTVKNNLRILALLLLLFNSQFVFSQIYPEYWECNYLKNKKIRRVDYYSQHSLKNLKDSSEFQITRREYITKPGKRFSIVTYDQSDTIHYKDSTSYS